MLISKLRSDGVFESVIQVADDTTTIPPGYSFSLPPEIPEGSHAVLSGEWRIVEGPAPELLSIVVNPYDEATEKIIEYTQNRLDVFAQTRGYDSMLSLVSYANSTNPKFVAEAQYGIESRDATWQKVYEILDRMKAGGMPLSYTDIAGELPALEWPADTNQ